MLFISPKKLLLFWRSLYFCSGIFCQVGKGLNKNVNAIFKIYGIKNWETDDYSTHIAQYLKKKDNLTMKFDQLTNCYWRNILLGKWHSKYGGKTSPWPFFLKKEQNWAFLRINNLELYTVCFYCMSKLRVMEIYWN